MFVEIKKLRFSILVTYIDNFESSHFSSVLSERIYLIHSCDMFSSIYRWLYENGYDQICRLKYGKGLLKL